MVGYEEWTAVSHTFEVRTNGDAILTVLSSYRPRTHTSQLCRNSA
jgi:hypothetical protein